MELLECYRSLEISTGNALYVRSAGWIANQGANPRWGKKKLRLAKEIKINKRQELNVNAVLWWPRSPRAPLLARQICWGSLHQFATVTQPNGSEH